MLTLWTRKSVKRLRRSPWSKGNFPFFSLYFPLFLWVINGDEYLFMFASKHRQVWSHQALTITIFLKQSPWGVLSYFPLPFVLLLWAVERTALLRSAFFLFVPLSSFCSFLRCNHWSKNSPSISLGLRREGGRTSEHNNSNTIALPLWTISSRGFSSKGKRRAKENGSHNLLHPKNSCSLYEWGRTYKTLRTDHSLSILWMEHRD